MMRTATAGAAIGLESIRRGLKREDDLRYVHSLSNHRAIYGNDSVPDEMELPLKGEEEMGHLVLGDFVTENNTESSGISPALASLITVIGLLSAGSAGMLAAQLLTGDKQPEQQVQPEPEVEVRDRVFDFGVEMEVERNG